MNREDKVKAIISSVLNVAPEFIRTDANLKDDLGATSLDRYTILMDIEEAFSLELDDMPEEELEARVGTVQDILDFLEEKAK